VAYLIRLSSDYTVDCRGASLRYFIVELGRRVPGKDEQGSSQPFGWVLPGLDSFTWATSDYTVHSASFGFYLVIIWAFKRYCFGAN